MPSDDETPMPIEKSWEIEMTKRRFANAAHQRAYDDWRKNPPSRRGGIGRAYVQGFEQPEQAPGVIVQRGSLSWVAFAPTRARSGWTAWRLR